MRAETARRAKTLNVTYKAGDDKKTNDMALDLINRINKAYATGYGFEASQMVVDAHNAMNIPFRIEFEANEYRIVK